ncbi:ornithine carbamoyltransferase [Malassezia vespertilionis]|uniref:ornithine carbamoyltransferase n=1 Tax=Malassezia vespertilionis TaxID=2020962 RepID=A0A2N1JBP0_9BASI|nr:ornithine carbamoyltransferase [Malassezia vespertilionis]PKI83970.1 Arg3p [Malassezia vespertilionis]WFD06697.1 ornithine carbamoyltransferase [Malassezia vespertilionis]
MSRLGFLSKLSPIAHWYGGARGFASSAHVRRAPSLITLGDLSVPELDALLQRASHFKKTVKTHALGPGAIEHTMANKTIAIMFTKRSTRTRVASETSVVTLGGHPMFLAPSDIQLGVNESLIDTSRVISSMVDGIMARVGAHEEIETLAEHSSVPVINALSSRFHPTQILADLLTLLEDNSKPGEPLPSLSRLNGLKVAWVGDSNNILNDILACYPRIGMDVSVAAPAGDAYAKDPVVWDMMQRGLTSLPAGEPKGKVDWCHSPEQAVHKANYVVTDTWVSMGDENSKAQRMQDFNGFQITEALCKRGKADPDWRFMHCLPRKAEEVDDEVFYGPRSLVFPEAENRKWTAMACFDWLFGQIPLV